MALPSLAALTLSVDARTVKSARMQKLAKGQAASDDKPTPTIARRRAAGTPAFKSSLRTSLEATKKRIMATPRAKDAPANLDVDVMPAQISREDAFYIQQLRDDGVLNHLCDRTLSELSSDFVRAALANDNNFIWLVRDTADAVFGFAIASTRRRYVKKANGGLERVLVLHLEAICSMGGRGMELFGNVLRFARSATDYRYFELEALSATLVRMYKETSEKVFDMDLVRSGLVGVSKADYEVEYAVVNEEPLHPLHWDLPTVR